MDQLSFHIVYQSYLSRKIVYLCLYVVFYSLNCISKKDYYPFSFISNIFFSFINDPVVFQQFMNKIFSNLLDICIMIYLDDILIYSNNMFKHHWCYNSKPLELDYEVTLYWIIQENLMESSLQNRLSYILVQMVCAIYCAPYPKWPYVKHEANM